MPASAGIHDTGWVCYIKQAKVINNAHNRVLHSAGMQIGRSKNAALNVDRILEITGQLGKQSK